jgi:DNA helicase HerA-like ATPase
MAKFRLPNSKQKIAIIGRTGSGKTVAALWHLSNAEYLTMPWIVLDFKGDENIAAITGTKKLEVGKIPDSPGIYIMQPTFDDLPALAETLQSVHANGGIGIYIDEGYMMRESADVESIFITLLTQGRSKHIPMIIVSQRPSWISRFVFSECDFFQLFHLQDRRDIKTIEYIIPEDTIIRLPDYHSIFFDVGTNAVNFLSPVPDAQKIVDKISQSLQSNIGQGTNERGRALRFL